MWRSMANRCREIELLCAASEEHPPVVAGSASAIETRVHLNLGELATHAAIEPVHPSVFSDRGALAREMVHGRIQILHRSIPHRRTITDDGFNGFGMQRAIRVPYGRFGFIDDSDLT